MVSNPTYEELEQRVKELEKEVKDLSPKETRLQIMADAVASSINAVALTDPQGKLIYVNNSCVKMWGYDNENEILGRSLPEFWEGDGIFNTIKELQEKGIASGEDIGKRKDGSLFTAQFSAKIFKDESGNPAYMFGSFNDITDEISLRESEDKYRSLVESTEDSIYLADRDGSYLFVNEKHLSRLGSPVDKVIGRTYGEFHSLDDTKEFEGQIEEVFETGQTTQHEHRSLRDDRYFLRTLSPVKGPDGHTASVTVVSKDITERELTHETLREHASMIENLLQRAADGICVCNNISDYPYVKFAHWNPRMTEITGYTVDEINKLGWYQAMYPDPDVQNRAIERMANMRMGDDITAEEWMITTKDGEKKHLSISTSVVKEEDGEIHVLGLMQDITERKQAEQQILLANDRLQYLLSGTSAVIYTADAKGDYGANFISENVSEMMGYEPREFLEDASFWFNHVHPEDHSQIPEEVSKLFGTGFHTFEYRFRHKDGTYIWVRDEIKVARDGDGTPLEIIGFWADISESKKTEEALRESVKEYKRLMENALIGVYKVEKDGKFITVNRKMAEMFGYDSPENFISSVDSITDLYARPEERPVILRDIDTKGSIYGKDVEFRKKDGERFWVKYFVRMFRDTGKIIYEGLMEDITESIEAEKERIDLEDQLQRAQKMEAMGLMAGGIAHDLNNILSGIVNYPELLLMDLPEDSPLRKRIKIIQESGMRAADVVEDLLTIARGVATGKEALNLNTLIREYLSSAEYEKLEKTHSFVDFKTELDPELLNMSGSPTHIKKILMNLIANASEAIEGSGTVTISAANRYLDEPLKGYEDIRTGEYALLSVSDDGSGISPEDLERVFEPFYTKKIMGRSGTGLGLAVVWNSVQDHDGYINVRSSEKGTVFELYFPTTREQVADEAEEIPFEDYLGHGEKILVVDDEETQREMACWLLTRLGYIAEAVSSGEEAIEYVKENPVDLIVLDMVMPKGINGRKTYEEIIKIRPGQKAIIASGYAKTKEVDKAQDLGAGKYIKKPYTLPKVGLAIKEELEK